MKKTITVNIKGLSFTIEEDAYEVLQKYLSRLSAAFEGQVGGDDIIEDLEIRIAELFNAKLNELKTVIEMSDVREVLTTLGEPEEMINDGDEDDDEEYSAHNSSHKSNHEKRLFRDEENAVLGGVCAGIANYFHLDVVVIRILFAVILFFGGFGIPLYIILWIAIPRAKNTIDRLRMKGRPINVETVKEEVEMAAEKMKEGTRKFASRVSDKGQYRRTASRGARILATIVGIGLIGFGLLHLITFTVFVIGGTQFIPIQSDTGFLSITDLGNLLLSNSADINLTWIGGLMAVLSAIFFLFLLGSMLIFRLRNRWSKLSLAGLFITGLIGFFICLSVGMRTARDLAIDGEIERLAGDVNAKEINIFPQFQKLTEDQSFHIKSNGQFGFFTLDGDNVKSYGVHFEYVKSADSLFHVYQNFTARSHTHKTAVKKSTNIVHGLSLNGDSLLVNTDFSFPKKDKIRAQEVVIRIEVPEGGQVKCRDEIVYISPKDPETDIDHPYYREHGYLRGDGTYRHHRRW